MSILSRLERIRGQIANCGGVLVTFKDGTRRTMDGGDCVHLIIKWTQCPLDNDRPRQRGAV